MLELANSINNIMSSKGLKPKIINQYLIHGRVCYVILQDDHALFRINKNITSQLTAVIKLNDPDFYIKLCHEIDKSMHG